jgi:uncharacterized protein (DUF169 family)
MKDAASRIRDILGLESHPVAVKFQDNSAPLKGFGPAEKSRYCQALMRARRGDSVYLTPDEITCPASARALGFKTPPEKLLSGEMPAAYGLFGSPGAASRTIADMPTLEMGRYKAVAVAPLEAAPFEPDVVVVEAKAEQVMWLALASMFAAGGRRTFSTGVLQATCVDATIVPFLSGEVNMSMGCYGCREATDMADDEAIIGIPGRKLPEIIASLEKLAEKAMPRVRSKAIYKMYVGEKERPDVGETAPVGAISTGKERDNDEDTKGL